MSLGEDRHKRAAVLDPAGVRHKAWIGGKLRRADDRREAGELSVVSNGHYQMAVGSVEHLVGHDARMRVSQSFRDGAGDEIAHRLICQHADLRIEKRHVDMRPLPGLVTAPERGKDCG